MDEYVKDPKQATDAGKVPEVGERGGIRYRVSSGASPIQGHAVFIGEIGDVGIFEVNGKYKAYIHRNDENHNRIVSDINDVLKSGGTIFDAIEEVKY